jgi:hypothetical protein
MTTLHDWKINDDNDWRLQYKFDKRSATAMLSVWAMKNVYPVDCKKEHIAGNIHEYLQFMDEEGFEIFTGTPQDLISKFLAYVLQLSWEYTVQASKFDG